MTEILTKRSTLPFTKLLVYMKIFMHHLGIYCRARTSPYISHTPYMLVHVSYEGLLLWPILIVIECTTIRARVANKLAFCRYYIKSAVLIIYFTQVKVLSHKRYETLKAQM